MDTFAVLLLVGLTAFRLTELAYDEDGPENVLLAARSYLMRWELFKSLFGCYWCLSVWAGFIAAVPALWLLPGADFPLWLLLSLSGSTIAIILSNLLGTGAKEEQ